MKKIISPISRFDLEKELNEETFIRKTNFCNHDIYIVDFKNQRNTSMEIGRLRELTFRNAGGGTGKSFDLDEFDTREEAFYKQLIVWDPDEKQIIGGYRFMQGSDIINSKKFNNSATNTLFNYNDDFYKNIFPYTIELGRSFVQPAYQPSSGNRKAIFSLDNLWDGLGALVVDYPEIRYLFGKVTMYLDFDKKGRDLILGFMNHFFNDEKKWITPKEPLKYHHDISYFKKDIIKLNYNEAYKILVKYLKDLKSSVPPLIAAYMNLSPSMKTFGTTMNLKFGAVEETGILISLKDIYPEKKDRHVNSYKKK